MYKKLNNLGFVIGVFFTIISLVLIIGGLVSPTLANKLNFYTGFVFLVFGLCMTILNRNNEQDDSAIDHE